MSAFPNVISLVSMPGGGKSTVGRGLAKRLKWGFADTDSLIEKKINCSISSFFQTKGEVLFRQVETDVLNDVFPALALVLATGGGIVLSDANRQLLKSRSTVVYLRSSPEELFRRLRNDTTRPLLMGIDPAAKIRQLYMERDPLYRDVADFVIETGRPSIPAVVNKVVMQLEMAGIYSGPVKI